MFKIPLDVTSIHFGASQQWWDFVQYQQKHMLFWLHHSFQWTHTIFSIIHLTSSWIELAKDESMLSVDEKPPVASVWKQTRLILENKVLWQTVLEIILLLSFSSRLKNKILQCQNLRYSVDRVGRLLSSSLPFPTACFLAGSFANRWFKVHYCNS